MRILSGIFLDRDGVILRKAAEGEYITNTEEMEFLPGSAEAIAELSRSGFKVVVVTNQRGVATGKVKLSDLENIHVRMRQVVATLGGEVCDVFYCPHDISDGCSCRKPKAGVLLQAAEKHQLALSQCWMVGDASTDITAGKEAGCKTALITQSREFSNWAGQPDIRAESLASAAEQILSLRPRNFPTERSTQG